MIVTYLDTSALVRLCAGEGDLTVVQQGMVGFPVSSVLAAVELRAAIHARFHHGRVDKRNRDRLLRMADHILRGIASVGFSEVVRREAVAVCERYLLRTLDAIHLGTAVVVQKQQRRRGNVLSLCTADGRQSEVASALLGSESVTLVPPY